MQWAASTAVICKVRGSFLKSNRVPFDVPFDVAAELGYGLAWVCLGVLFYF